MHEQTDGFSECQLEQLELGSDITRREAAKRLQAGILFLFTFEEVWKANPPRIKIRFCHRACTWAKMVPSQY